jgi:DNA topoisomerase-1
VEVRDRRLARVVKRCQDVPGQELFQYVDGEGERRSVDSADVNDYLRESSGGDFTAKDFRTWAGTILAARLFRKAAACSDDTPAAEAKRRVVEVIEQVASALGNTVAVCRKCYVHPAVIEAYLAGALTTVETLAGARVHDAANESAPYDLSPEERTVIALLRAAETTGDAVKAV